MANPVTRTMSRLAVLYSLLIVLIIVAADLGRLPVRRAMAILPWLDKLGHFLLIGSLAFLVNAALGARRYRWLRLGWLVGSCWLGLAVVLEEISQRWLPERAFELEDLVADFVGILLFGWLARLWVGRWGGEGALPLVTVASPADGGMPRGQESEGEPMGTSRRIGEPR